MGTHAGEQIEDLGITRDKAHKMTRNDLLKGNVDLLNAAGKILAKGTPRQFDVTLKIDGQKLNIELTTMNIDAVDLYVDGRPEKGTTAISDGETTIEIKKPGRGSLLEIDGVHSGDVVASRKHLV